MINLFISYYIDKSTARQKELDDTLLMNINCDAINKIYALTDGAIESPLLENDKVMELVYKARPSYNTFFEAIRSFSSDEDWNIIANSDIYFDETIAKIYEYPHTKPLCFALTRWEVEKDSIHFLNRWDSQDCWIFKGKPKNVQGNFNMGVAGCDNAIAERFSRAGYNVINPSKTIKTYHLHKSGVRSYNPNFRAPQPYKLLTPTI